MPDELYKSFKFIVEIDNMPAAAFTKVSGFGVSVDRVQYRAGNELLTTTTGVPTFTQYENITFTRGIIDNLDLMDWMFTLASTADLPPTLVNAKRDLTIVLLKDDGSRGTEWQITGATPVSYKINDLDGLGGDLAVESLEVSIAGFKRVNPAPTT